MGEYQAYIYSTANISKINSYVHDNHSNQVYVLEVQHNYAAEQVKQLLFVVKTSVYAKQVAL